MMNEPRFSDCLDVIGITGLVQMDDNADRQPDFWLWYNGPDVEAMTPFMELVMTNPEGEVEYSLRIIKVFIYSLCSS